MTVVTNSLCYLALSAITPCTASQTSHSCLSDTHDEPFLLMQLQREDIEHKHENDALTGESTETSIVLIILTRV